MAVVDRDSAGIALQEANSVLTSQLAPNYVREVVGVIATGDDDTNASIHRFVRVPSNARISSVLLSHAVAGTAGKYDIGIYQTVENGGALVDVDLFASAFDLNTALSHNRELAYESGEYTFAESETYLWQVLGLTVDPHIEYDVVGLVQTTFNSGPTSVRLAVRYTQ